MSIKSLRYIYDYLSNRKHRVRINNDFSEWRDIIYGIPQGSILSPLFFNIYLIDLFYFTDNFRLINYANDNTTYACEINVEEVITTLENSAKSLFQWINHNFLKVNPDKSHVVLSDNETKTLINQSESIQSTHKTYLVSLLIVNSNLIPM